MQQHAIPQNITGFEFKLIGFMTLRQFGYLAGGGAIAFLMFIAVQNFFLKWILVVLIAGGGAAFAFLPVNAMPLDKWIIVFTKAILAPTRRIWRKEPKVIGYFGPEFTYYLRRSIKEKPKAITDRRRLDSLINEIRRRENFDELDLQHRSINPTQNLPQEAKGARPWAMTAE